ncbi:Ribosomal RNA small subunit methyltransferase D [Buchnera aphidicola (Thelaxes suberi)]|uniref:16S rRNA (guanine(966)-N(2))-methyltransferase RsmD n=1 Tax=Buchnera aphidicola TaxID=9 RepID=UPI003464BDC9
MQIKIKKNNIKIRITGGYLRSQYVYTQRSINMRPTISIRREMLFNWLDSYIYESSCLDCFSGSGILSIESISRHAKFVTALEIQKKNILSIRSNMNRLLINNVKIVHTNTLKWLNSTNNNSFDIIFIDPPFYLNIINKIITLIYKNNFTKKDSLIYVEFYGSVEDLKIPKSWKLYKIKMNKKKKYILYKCLS